MKRLALVLVSLAALVGPAAAAAHPLGNFTTNRYTRLEVSGSHLYALHVLDLAEIPTFQAQAVRRRLGQAAYANGLARRIASSLELTVDGRRRALQPLHRSLALRPGAGGLRTTRLELVLDAGPLEPGSPARIRFADRSYPGRIGWREVVVTGTEGARVLTASVPARSVSRELRAYPTDLLTSPLDVSSAIITVEAGAGAGKPPSVGAKDAAPAEQSGGFAGLISEDDLGPGVILLSLLAALFWGGAHALTPGHGKAIVAAYMVGTRGNARHAFLLGGIVTVTHTIGVFGLGLVTLALSEFIVPERLYPWLNLASALLVVALGVTVLRFRLLGWLRGRAHARAHHRREHHHHGHDHEHDHDHGPGGHSHVPEPGSGLRGLVAVGVSGGLLPCPTALVVLLAAISLQRVGYGFVLIIAFSIGLASVVTAIGLLAVGSRRLFNRVSLNGPVVRALPAASAVVIIVLGLAMTLRALPSIA